MLRANSIGGVLGMTVPIVGAPLAGGPGTPALARAVSDAGGLGFLAAGYRTADEVAQEMAALRGRPFGVNVFFPVRDAAPAHELAAYARSLQPEAERFGVAPGEPRWTDDGWGAKLELLLRDPPAVVSFTFGCPEREVVDALRRAGSAVWCTVTSPAEATRAAGNGVDGLVVQGAEAGGHRGSFADGDADPLPLLPLLQLVTRVTDLPLVAAGGIASREAVAAVLAAGARAAQVGTALLRTPEAATSEPHRRALEGATPTRLTRAFTGRRARGIVNRFMEEHDAAAPRGYPEINAVTAPIRAAARAQGDAEAINLWAGQAYPLARDEAAGTVIERLTPR
jgi:nitronate monooxygenase